LSIPRGLAVSQDLINRQDLLTIKNRTLTVIGQVHVQQISDFLLDGFPNFENWNVGSREAFLSGVIFQVSPLRFSSNDTISLTDGIQRATSYITRCPSKTAASLE